MEKINEELRRWIDEAPARREARRDKKMAEINAILETLSFLQLNSLYRELTRWQGDRAQ